jgi:SAM-dependent methyltransferase
MRRIRCWEVYDRLARTGNLDGVSATLEAEPEDQARPDESDSEVGFFCSALAGRRRVLDLGCGTGVTLAGLARCVGTVCGLDASPAMLALAARGLCRVPSIRSVALVRGLAEALPFPDGTFDGIAVAGTLESVDAPDLVLSELSRVTVPGALVASLEWDFRGLLEGDSPRVHHCLRRDAEGLVLEIRYLLTDPYRVRHERYAIESSSEFARSALAAHDFGQGGRASTDLRPADIPRDALTDAFYDVEHHWDPRTLRDAFELAACELVEQRVTECFGVPHIFSVFRRRGRS